MIARTSSSGRRQPGRVRGPRAEREPQPGHLAESGRSQASEKDQPPHGLHFRLPVVSRHLQQGQGQSPIAVRKETMVHLAAEPDPLSKAGKPSPPGRRSAGSGGNHRSRENLHDPLIPPAVSRRRHPRKARKERLPDRKGAMPRCVAEPGPTSDSVRGPRDPEGIGRRPGPRPAPSLRFVPRKGLAPIDRLIG